jgi:hypothetical protein
MRSDLYFTCCLQAERGTTLAFGWQRVSHIEPYGRYPKRRNRSEIDPFARVQKQSLAPGFDQFAIGGEFSRRLADRTRIIALHRATRQGDWSVGKRIPVSLFEGRTANGGSSQVNGYGRILNESSRSARGLC